MNFVSSCRATVGQLLEGEVLQINLPESVASIFLIPE